jgi:hypothetical protein
MPVTNLADYKPLFKLAKSRGIDIQAVVCNPGTVVALVDEIVRIGEKPFLRCRRTWKRLWRKPDPRPFLYGVPVICNPTIPMGHVGMATLMPMPPDLAEMFKGDLKIGSTEPSQTVPLPPVEPGVMSMLSESVNGQKASLTDLMVKAMDNVDTANGLIVLRFWDNYFDVTTNFNPLEVQTAIQRALMRITSDGMEGKI